MRPGRAAAAIALATLAIRSAAGRDIVEVMAYVLLLFIPLSLALRYLVDVTTWFEGLSLVGVYLLFALAYYLRSPLTLRGADRRRPE